MQYTKGNNVIVDTGCRATQQSNPMIRMWVDSDNTVYPVQLDAKKMLFYYFGNKAGLLRKLEAITH